MSYILSVALSHFVKSQVELFAELHHVGKLV